MNIKQFIWLAFWSTSAIFAVTFLITTFRPMLSKPEFLGIVLFFILLIVVVVYQNLGRMDSERPTPT